jgi:hypothetical protein
MTLPLFDSCQQTLATVSAAEQLPREEETGRA